ncbi:MAG: YqcC family protein [Pseudomonadales bacterium]|jgi:uncharacterized protein YqcC (DUF446 family)|nr:YqcC family protein [Pseudomonadales bacterium]
MPDDVERYARVADLLLSIETELRRAGLWADLPPGPEALASEVPFARDALDLTGWLQFVLLPRMAALLEHGAPLPTECAIRPLAEVEFAGRGVEALIDVLGEFDALLVRPVP